MATEKLEAVRGDYWSLVITGLGPMDDRTRLIFCIKASYDLSDPSDENSLVKIEETDGLLVSDRAPALDPTLGKITVADETSGDLIVNLSGSESGKLDPYDLAYWEVQKYVLVNGNNEPVTMQPAKEFEILQDVIKS